MWLGVCVYGRRPTYLWKQEGVSNDNEKGLCSANGHVESFGVAKETKVVAKVKV